MDRVHDVGFLGEDRVAELLHPLKLRIEHFQHRGRRGQRFDARVPSLLLGSRLQLFRLQVLVVLNLGAEIDGKLVGFMFGEIKLWEFGRAEKTGWIKVLAVDPEYQGMGVGLRLGETILGHFQKKNVKKVRTLVEWHEGNVISYFKSLGFNMLGMLPLEKEI